MVGAVFWLINDFNFFDDETYQKTHESVGYACFVSVEVFSILLVVDAFRRLKMSLEHDQLQIKNKLVVLHIVTIVVALTVQTVQSTAFLILLSTYFGDGNRSIQKWFYLLTWSTETSSWVTASSGLPTLAILTRIIKKMIVEQRPHSVENFSTMETSQTSNVNSNQQSKNRLLNFG